MSLTMQYRILALLAGVMICTFFPSSASAQDDTVALGPYARAEFGAWWTKGAKVPALVSTSPDGTPRPDAGVLGTPGATVLDGNERLGNDIRLGGRLLLGYWLDEDQTAAIEGSILYGGNDGENDFTILSPGSPIVSRPFFNATTHEEDAELVAFPDVLSGRVTVDSDSEFLSPDIYLRHRCREGTKGRVDILAGYRYFRLRDSLSVTENLVSTDLGGVIPLGTTTDLQDRFIALNEFHAAEFGASAEFTGSTLSLELLAKVAIGSLHRRVDVQGETLVHIPDLSPTLTPGGLLAQPTNIGTYQSDRFAVLPELGATAKVQLTDRLSLTAGYSLIMLSDVVRASEQVDRVVNVSQLGGDPIVGQRRPRLDLADNDFWAQSLNVGLEFR